MRPRLTDEQLEEEVRRVLRRIGLEDQRCPDLLTVITKLRAAFPEFTYRRVPDHQMPDAYAKYDSETSTILIRESTFAGMQRREPRARMTIWEEIAHFILGHKGLLNRSIEKTIVERTVARVRRQEAEAKRCAAVLAAPAHLVDESMSIDEIANIFGLSRQAASYRFEEVARLRRRERGENRPLTPTAIDYLREARRRGIQLRTDLGD